VAKAIVDPDAVRAFARDLDQFSAELESQLAALHGRLKRLGESWQDQEHAAFAGEFERTLRQMARFCESSRDHAPYLMRKAQRAEDYLNQR
jgi:uncharacterized protein YukE